MPKQLSETVDETDRDIFEFGNGGLAVHFLTDLGNTMDTYNRHADDLLAMATIRAIDTQPLKLHRFRWEQFALSRNRDARLSSKHLSTTLQETGLSVGWLHGVFSSLFDATTSCSAT